MKKYIKVCPACGKSHRNLALQKVKEPSNIYGTIFNYSGTCPKLDIRIMIPVKEEDLATTGKLKDAIALAQLYHKDQKYADEPYINHLLRVCKNVNDFEKNETFQIVAILHDIIEDTACTAEEVECLFGAGIASAVKHMSHQKGENYFSYLDNVLRNPVAKFVKFADIMDNWKNSYINIGYERLQDKYEKAMKYMIANWNKYN